VRRTLPKGSPNGGACRSVPGRSVRSVVAWLTFAGVVLGLLVSAGLAVLTVMTTDRRQDRQLNAEAARHSAQLAHERELAQLDSRRALLDDVGATMFRASRTFRAADGKAVNADGEQRNAALEAMVELQAAAGRVIVRFGPEDQLTDSSQAAATAAAGFVAELARISLRPKPPPNETDEVPLGKLRGQHRDFDEAFAAFVWAATRQDRQTTLPGPTPPPEGT